MKASICLLLGVAVFSTLFLESSTASTGNNGLLDGVLGGVGGLVGNLVEVVKQLLGTVTPTVDKLTGLLTSLWNEVGTLVTDATGAAKDVMTKAQPIIGNLLDTVAKIPTVIANGTTKSLDEGSALAATGEGLVKQLADIFVANPEVAGSLNSVGAVLNIAPELLESIKKSINQFKVQVSV